MPLFSALERRYVAPSMDVPAEMMMSDLAASPRVLAVHAHPDDVELLCAGTLLRLRDRGCQIVIATMTPGDKGSVDLAADSIADVRMAEAARSAGLLGAEYVCLGFRDLEFDFDDRCRRVVVEALRKARPQIVLTAPPVDFMTDHEVTSRLVRDACFSAAVPNYETREESPAPPLARIPHLYYLDSMAGTGYFGEPIEPQFVVDISAVFERKLEMLACHESQREWLRRLHGIDEYLDSCRRFGARRGLSAGSAFGEGFRQHTGHPYPPDNFLMSLLRSG